MSNDIERKTSILGDINPQSAARDHDPRVAPVEGTLDEAEGAAHSMAGGSRHDRSKHPGSRDVTEGTTAGAEVGGTRNFRTGSGAIGSDIGNRPE